MTTDPVARINRLSAEVAALSDEGEFARALPLAAELCNLVRELVGEADPAYAAVLDQRAKLHLDTADYTAAEALLRESMVITRAALGDRHPSLASRLNGLALIAKTTGRPLEATGLYAQAVDIYQAQPDGQQVARELFSALRNLAHLQLALGELGEALASLEQASGVLDRAAGDVRPQKTLLHHSLGRWARHAGDDRSAERHLRRALRLGRAAYGDAHRHVATIVHELAGVARDRGRHLRAIRLLDWLLATDRRAVGEEHPDMAATLLALAELHLARHEYDAARTHAAKGLDIQRRFFGEMHADTANAMNTLAEACRSGGRIAEADRLYHDALSIRRQVLGNDHPDVAASLHNWALLKDLMGDYVALHSLETEALAIVGRVLPAHHPLTATIVSNLAAAFEATGDYVSAESLLRRSLEIRRRLYGSDHAVVGHALNNLGALFLRAGDAGRAEALFRQALDVYRRALGEENLCVGYALNNLGTLLAQSGRWSEAKLLLIDALAIRRSQVGSDHPLVATALTNLAAIGAAAGDIAGAFTCISEAASIGDRLIAQVFSVGSERQRLDYLRVVEDPVHLMLTLARRHIPGDAAVVRSAFELVLRRKGIAAEVFARQREAVLGGRAAGLRERLEELDSLKWRIVERTMAGPEKDAVEHGRLLASLHARRDELESGLARSLAEIDPARAMRAADAGAVARALAPGTALVDVVRFSNVDFTVAPGPGRPLPGNGWYIAFVVRAGATGEVEMVDLGAASRIDALARAYLELVSAKNPLAWDVGREHAAGTALRIAALDPVLERLDGWSSLLVSSDGELLRVPLEILPLDDGSRVIDKIAVSYLSAARDILRFAEEPARPPRSALVLADPDFDLAVETGGADPSPSASGEGKRPPREIVRFATLPGTRAEGEAVAARLGVRLRAGRRAVKRLVKRYRAPRVLHIATHGFFLPDSPLHGDQSSPAGGGGPLDAPRAEDFVRLAADRLANPMLRSGLALAGANTWLVGGALPAAAEDGILTAEDVTGLDLLGTELVVLSACDTGLGEVARGEGVFGLRRGFTLAGARTLVISLWQVPDRATCALVEEFYRGVFAGVPRAAALRRAQQWVRKSHPQPFYWGAFITLGDPGPLRPP